MESGAYDFVIVGGGIAGLVLATRLSENPSQRILVLEAGADHSEDPRVKTPAFYSAKLKTEVDWGFQTTDQPELNGRIINLNQDNPWANPSIGIGAFSNLASIDPVRRERSHAARTYYGSAKDRKNLHVLTNAVVEKVLLKEHSTEVIGVQYCYKSETKTVTARKEVIIAAGALQSPKLLELSGVGNADLLGGRNIKVTKNLPGVGENLQDHLVCDLVFDAGRGLETLDALQEPGELEQAMHEYMTNHSGFLTSAGIKTYAYMPVTKHLSGEGREALKKLLQQNHPQGGESPDQSQSRARAYYEVAENTLLSGDEPSAAYLTAIAQYPVAPDPDTDIEIYAEHMLYLHTIAASPPLNSLFKQPPKLSAPLAYFTDSEAVKKYIRSRAISMWHPAGTCAMLPEEKGGVVNTQLKVYGIQNLRIVDSSVVLLLPSGNLQSTVYALAEKAADLIKKEYGLRWFFCTRLGLFIHASL
ncbi:hypothetical protein DL768_007521 [Monosporascus sp. mg162]|nr:hypothetical protein DL768_007521 [Monosporascus sp. mg162]